jgi:hypothetical protein
MGEIIIALKWLVAVPALIAIHVLLYPPLMARNFFHRMCRWGDAAFDAVARWAGGRPEYWPLPRASDSSLPCRKRKYCYGYIEEDIRYSQVRMGGFNGELVNNDHQS